MLMRFHEIVDQAKSDWHVRCHVEALGTDGQVTRQTYGIVGVPGLEAELKVLNYGEADPGRVVQTIEVWPERFQGYGFAQALYLAALRDGPLDERPQFQTADAARCITSLLTKRKVQRQKTGRGSQLSIRT